MPRFMRIPVLVATGFIAGLLCGPNLIAVAQDRAGSAPLTLLSRVSEAMEAIRKTFIGTTDERKLVDGCIAGMVAATDPNGSYHNQQDFREITRSSADRPGTVGLDLQTAAGYPVVMVPIDGAPAARAGIEAGDVIERIDGMQTRLRPLAEVYAALRGMPGSTVSVAYRRGAEALTRNVTLIREIFAPEPVRASRIEAGLIHVRIRQFREDTGAQMVDELRKRFGEGEVKGVVLDLRGNTGGLLQVALGVTSAFLPRDIVLLRGLARPPAAPVEYRARTDDYVQPGGRDYLLALPPAVKSVPLVVLVDGTTVSGAEIVAGVLQEYKRATIVGARTFGNGSLRTLTPLSGGTAIVLTSSEWITPGGRRITPDGIAPDVGVERRADDPEAPLTRAMSILAKRS